MYTEEDIESAVKAGVINQETAESFRQYIAGQKNTHIVDEEQFHLITGFNDIFVVIASSLLLGAVVWIGNTFVSLGAPAAVIVSWGLGEFFIRKRKMALPAIVLLLAFVVSVYFSAEILLSFVFHMAQVSHDGFLKSAACAIAAIAAWFHWKRFHVPITVAAAAGAITGCALIPVFFVAGESFIWLRVMAFTAGICVFAFAMWWDMSDTLRQTRRSDVAFWLHLLAAPLIVHPVFVSLYIFDSTSVFMSTIIILALYIFIALVSILIDRRALMVSSLGYVIYAFSSLLETFGTVSLGFAVTALLIGGALLFLAAFWHSARTFVFRFVSQKVTRHLPPLR